MVIHKEGHYYIVQSHKCLTDNQVISLSLIQDI